MGQFFDVIPASLIPWIEDQKIFWVATAPLAEDGHVNVSPKGCFEKTLNIIRDEESNEDEEKRTSRAVWYEDLTGSGIETIAHLRENGRITLMLTAFEGPPRITRLYGTGKVYEFGTPEYDALLPPGRRQPGSRAAIWIDVHKVSTACGYSIPFFDYRAPRTRLHLKFAVLREGVDREYEDSCPAPTYQATPSSSEDASSDSIVLVTAPGASTILLPAAVPTHSALSVPQDRQLPEKGMRYYWKNRNPKSLDGLPGLTSAYASQEKMGEYNQDGQVFSTLVDDESEKMASGVSGLVEAVVEKRDRWGDDATGKVVIGFAFGLLAGVALSRLR